MIEQDFLAESAERASRCNTDRFLQGSSAHSQLLTKMTKLTGGASVQEFHNRVKKKRVVVGHGTPSASRKLRGWAAAEAYRQSQGSVLSW